MQDVLWPRATVPVVAAPKAKPQPDVSSSDSLFSLMPLPPSTSFSRGDVEGEEDVSIHDLHISDSLLTLSDPLAMPREVEVTTSGAVTTARKTTTITTTTTKTKITATASGVGVGVGVGVDLSMNFTALMANSSADDSRAKVTLAHNTSLERDSTASDYDLDSVMVESQQYQQPPEKPCDHYYAYIPHTQAYAFATIEEQPATPVEMVSVQVSDFSVGTDVRLRVVNHLCQQLQLQRRSSTSSQSQSQTQTHSRAAHRTTVVGSSTSDSQPPQGVQDVRKKVVNRIFSELGFDPLFSGMSAERRYYLTAAGTMHRGSSSSGITIASSNSTGISTRENSSSGTSLVGANLLTPTSSLTMATAPAIPPTTMMTMTQRTRGVAYCIGTKCVHADFWKRLRAKKGIAHYVCQFCNKKWRTISSKIWNPQTGFTEEGAQLYNFPLSIVAARGGTNQLTAWQDLLQYTAETKSPQRGQPRSSYQPRHTSANPMPMASLHRGGGGEGGIGIIRGGGVAGAAAAAGGPRVSAGLVSFSSSFIPSSTSTAPPPLAAHIFPSSTGMMTSTTTAVCRNTRLAFPTMM